MTNLKIAELLSARDSDYKWATVETDVPHEAKIVHSQILPSKFGGQVLKIVFEYQAEEYAGRHISSLVTYMNSFGKVHKSLSDFMDLFFDLSDPEKTIDTEDLIGRKCRIIVENQASKSWQRVSETLSLEPIKIA